MTQRARCATTSRKRKTLPNIRPTMLQDSRSTQSFEVQGSTTYVARRYSIPRTYIHTDIQNGDTFCRGIIHHLASVFQQEPEEVNGCGTSANPFARTTKLLHGWYILSRYTRSRYSSLAQITYARAAILLSTCSFSCAARITSAFSPVRVSITELPTRVKFLWNVLETLIVPTSNDET